jgi:threonine/homoserine efflux transporter RhtA
MLVALVVITPVGLKDALPAFTSASLLLAGIGVGMCSSVVPSVTDQLAMAVLPRATFALRLALQPAWRHIGKRENTLMRSEFAAACFASAAAIAVEEAEASDFFCAGWQ